MAVSGEELLCALVPRLNASFKLTRATIDRAIDEAVTKVGYSRASNDHCPGSHHFVLGRDVSLIYYHTYL